MPKAVSIPNQAPGEEPGVTHRALSPDEIYFRQQAEAIRRIYAPFYPDQRVRIVLKALDNGRGNPEGVQIIKGSPGFSVIDEFYLGFMDFGEPAAAAAITTVAKDSDEDEGEDDGIAITIIAGVPRRFRKDQAAPEKTWPDYHDKPALNWLLRKSPVLFEQLKYQYEMRDRQQRTRRHAFTSINRASAHPLGQLVEGRDLTRPPAILIGFHWLEMGGAEKLAFDCVKWARDAGLRVLVVAERPEIHRHAAKLLDDPNVEFIRTDAYLHPNGWFDLLEKLIRAENIRAIHIHHNIKLYDNLMKLKAVFPDLVTIDSTHIVEYSNGGFPRTSGVWTRYIDHHHVISRELVSFYLDQFGVSGKVMLGRMLDPAENRKEQAAPALRLSAGQSSCRLAFVGRMVHQKRAPLIVAIVQKLQKWAKEKGIKLQVDMVGTGLYLDVVKHMIHRANLSSVITLHPADTDVPALLGKADVLVLPSSNEGLALVCYEAIENGAIPISTDVGGQEELIATDLLVPASPLRCVRDTAALIKRLMSDEEFLATCKADTLTRYNNLRSDPTAQEEVTALYRDIAKGAVKK